MKKMVRDRIPYIIAKEGRAPKFEVLDDKRIVPFVEQKLQEELNELLSASSYEERAKEAADLLQVLHKYCEVHGISWGLVQHEYDLKRQKAGAFTENIVLELDDGV